MPVKLGKIDIPEPNKFYKILIKKFYTKQGNVVVNQIFIDITKYLINFYDEQMRKGRKSFWSILAKNSKKYIK